MEVVESRCNTDREFCEKIDRLINSLLTGNAVLRSCRGRALFGFRPVAESENYVTVSGADGEKWIIVDIVLSTGAMARLIMDREELCVYSAEVAFSYVRGGMVSHYVIARN